MTHIIIDVYFHARFFSLWFIMKDPYQSWNFPDTYEMLQNTQLYCV